MISIPNSLDFHPEVASDLKKIIRYYEATSVDLSDRFRTNVEVAFRQVATRPWYYPKAIDDIRFVRVDRFP